jgi:hypothetical protein
MLKLNAKEVVIKKALDYKVCSILNPETQQNVLFRQMENLVPKTPKAEKGKSLYFRNVFEVCDGPSRSDSKISNSLTVNVIQKTNNKVLIQK